MFRIRSLTKVTLATDSTFVLRRERLADGTGGRRGGVRLAPKKLHRAELRIVRIGDRRQGLRVEGALVLGPGGPGRDKGRRKAQQLKASHGVSAARSLLGGDPGESMAAPGAVINAAAEPGG